MVETKLIDVFGNGRTTVENDILLNNKLTATEKIVYMYIEMLSYKDNYCYATNKQIAELSGQTKRSITGAILKLKRKKYIVVDTLQTRVPYKRRVFTETRFLRAWNSNELPNDCTVKEPPNRIEELDREAISKSFAKFRKFLKLYLTEKEFLVKTEGELFNKKVLIKKNGYYRNTSDDKELTKEKSQTFEMLMYDKRDVLLDSFFHKGKI